MSANRTTDWSFVGKSFLAGGIAGMTSKTTVAPLDRIKILLQAHNDHYKHCGVMSGLRHIVRHEGMMSLYKGNTAMMVRIFPYAAVQFLSFETYKKALKQFFGYSSHSSKFFAGSSAGVTAVMLTYPLDMIRARLAFQISGQHIYNGMMHTFKEIVTKEGGIRALYKGLTPTLIGMIPYAGLNFYFFERLKHLCLERMPEMTGTIQSSSGHLILTVPAKLFCGGVAGAIAQTFSYPMDVARRRMQLSMMRPETQKYSGLTTTLVLVFREHGVVRGLYRGMTANYIRAIPMVSVSFATYEVMKQALGLDTGLST